MRLFSVFLVFFAIPITLYAQHADVEIPTLTPPHFSRIVGKYDIHSSATPTEVQVEEPITLKVQILGNGPEKYRPQRQNLDIFPEDLENDFHLEAVADRDKLMPEKGRWEFVYRLRPKREDVTRLPELKLTYYVPQTKRFEPSFAEEIPIKVTPRPEAGVEKLELKIVRAPERFYQVRPMEEVLRDDRPMPSPGPGLLTALWAAPPFLCFIWYRVWRRLFPNAAERSRRRRSRAARLALAYLAKQQDDVPRTRAAAVDYLRQRLDLAALEATPHEVTRHLQRWGLAKPLIAQWADFFQTCDRFRFAPSPELPKNPLPAEAIRLIHALETDPCHLP